jgi:asparagine synthetase B (glutamine-hydrolysing)
MLQRWLDDHGSTPRRLFDLDGDFLLSYRAPNNAFCLLYRPLTAAHTLYYRLSTQSLDWSTRLETLFEHTPTLDAVEPSLLPALVCAGEPDPEQTPYRGIRCLRAGQCLSISHDGALHMEYDDFQWEDLSSLPFEEAAALYRHYCTEALRQATYGVTHLGVFLSGGLDSAVLALQAQALGCQVEGFHWTWSHLPCFQSEQRAARLLADHLQIPLHLVDGRTFLEPGGRYLQVLRHLPLPYNHSFFTSFQQTAKLAHQQDISLLLTGHLGDTLFESERNDGIWEKLSQGHWLSACGDLLSCFSRQQAWHMLWTQSIARKAVSSPSGAGQRMACCSWLTPFAREQALALRQYVYQTNQTRVSASTRRVYQAILTNINSETIRDGIRSHYALFPQGVALKHPYLNRKLIEYCLSLGRSHRAFFAAGEDISKPLARYAYLESLPAALVRREVRLPYAAVDESYALHNQEALFDLLGKESCLGALGIVDQQQLTPIFADPDKVQRHAESFLPAAGVELWLRHLAGRPWQQPDPPPYRKPALWKSLPRLATPQPETPSCLALAPFVEAYEIHQDLILLQRTTDQVLKLDQTTHLFVRLVAHEQSISQALATFSAILEEPVDEGLWRAVLVQLGKQGWIVLSPQGQVELEGEKAKHV